MSPPGRSGNGFGCSSCAGKILNLVVEWSALVEPELLRGLVRVVHPGRGPDQCTWRARSRERAPRPGPKAAAKWLSGSVIHPPEDTIAAAFDQAEARDPGHLRTWVVLVDGARHQLDLIHAEADHRLTTILHGQAARAAPEITTHADRGRLSGARRDANDACVGYLTRHPDQLRHDTALAAGWPIATGAIEGACRHLTGDRLDITGARWA